SRGHGPPRGRLAGRRGRPPGRSFQRERLAVEILRALHLDENRESLLIRIALLLGLDEAAPDLLVGRAGLVNLRGAVEPGDVALRQHAGFAQLGLSEKDRDLGPVLEIGVRRALATLPERQMLVVV